MWSVPQKRRWLFHLCVSLINWLTTRLTWPFSVETSLSFFPHLHFSQRLSCVPLLSVPTSPRPCGFLGLMRIVCFSSSCVCDALALSLPEPASHHKAGAGWGLLSWSPLALRYQLELALWWTPEWCFLRGKPEQSSAGELCAWPGLLMLDNKQTQQFSWVSHLKRERWAVNLERRTLVITIYHQCFPLERVLCLFVFEMWFKINKKQSFKFKTCHKLCSDHTHKFSIFHWHHPQTKSVSLLFGNARWSISGRKQKNKQTFDLRCLHWNKWC